MNCCRCGWKERWWLTFCKLFDKKWCKFSLKRPTIPDVQTVEQKDVIMQIETPPFPVSSRHFGMDKQFAKLKLSTVNLSNSVMYNV